MRMTYLRRGATQFKHTYESKPYGHWCPFRPDEEHVLKYRERSHMGDVWMCDQCNTVWIAVLRPSLLDAVPHWSIKWKRMSRLRAWAWQAKTLKGGFSVDT
jgi:Zn-finger protein